jgi:hypothetical protein
VRRRISRFIGGAAALLPPMPTFMSSRFFSNPRAASKQPDRKPAPAKPSGPS